jgi:hypothetical protein
VSTAAAKAPHSLYVVLGEPAPESAEAGETSITRAKETLDDDREAVWVGGFGEI